MAPKQKFATEIDPEVLARAREVAQQAGLDFQSFVEEALIHLVEMKTADRSRPDVMAHYEVTVQQYDGLFEQLAK